MSHHSETCQAEDQSAVAFNGSVHASASESAPAVHTDAHPSGNQALTPSRLEEIEQAMRNGAVDLVDLPVRNYFSKGVYARELFIPKGTILTGKIHKYANLNILSKGDLSVLTENGITRISAPFTCVSPPGTKRIAYAHEDTIWTTIHGTDEVDVNRIEDEFTSNSYADYLLFCEQSKIEGG